MLCASFDPCCRDASPQWCQDLGLFATAFTSTCGAECASTSHSTTAGRSTSGSTSGGGSGWWRYDVWPHGVHGFWYGHGRGHECGQSCSRRRDGTSYDGGGASARGCSRSAGDWWEFGLRLPAGTAHEVSADEHGCFRVPVLHGFLEGVSAGGLSHIAARSDKVAVVLAQPTGVGTEVDYAC